MSETYEYGDYNRGGMMAFSFAMVFTLGFFIYIAFIHSGVDLDEIPKPPAEKEAPKEAGDSN